MLIFAVFFHWWGVGFDTADFADFDIGVAGANIVYFWYSGLYVDVVDAEVWCLFDISVPRPPLEGAVKGPRFDVSDIDIDVADMISICWCYRYPYVGVIDIGVEVTAIDIWVTNIGIDVTGINIDVTDIDIDVTDIGVTDIGIDVTNIDTAIYGLMLPISVLMLYRHWYYTHSMSMLFVANMYIYISIYTIGAVKEPPKNSRAAGLRSDERVKRDKNRKFSEEAAFEQEKLLFERERAKVLETRDQGGWVVVLLLAHVALIFLLQKQSTSDR